MLSVPSDCTVASRVPDALQAMSVTLACTFILRARFGAENCASDNDGSASTWMAHGVVQCAKRCFVVIVQKYGVRCDLAK